ncbi:MAG: MATE family efflux transporter [Erysipelotrichaceae bacterium]|nr:MATE family efflux transporter [Erysipelotrichaceae bacterium]
MLNKRVDMLNGALLPNIMAFAIPLMITNLLQMIFTAADTIVVGKFAGQIPLAAVGATGSIIFLFTALLQGLSTGTNVVVAQRIGANDKEGVSRAVHTSILMGLIGGIFISILAFICARPLLTVLSTPGDIIEYSITYMRVYLSSAVFISEYNFLSGILRAKGDTKRPMYYLMIAGVINVLLNLVFVIVFKWAVVGVALATAMSQVISAVLCFIALCNDKDDTHFEFKYLVIDEALCKEIVRIGIPAGLQGMAFSFTNIIVQSAINSFDSSSIVAGNTAAANIENFIYIGMMAFCNATVTFTSQNVGANKKERILPIFNITMLLSCVSAFVIGFLAWYKGRFFLSFYTSEEAVIDYGMIRLFYLAVFLFLNACLDVFAGSLRGMGKSTSPTLIMMIGIIGTRLLWISTVFKQYGTLESLYICFPVSWFVTIVIYLVVYIFHMKKFLRN